MNQRTLVLVVMLFAVAVGGFSALYESHDERVIPHIAQPATIEPIDKLTEQQRVISYLRQHRQLPNYYITKKQAREQGWDAGKGNLCAVLPGKAIGGDHFSNREGRLPTANNRLWREADINYHCGRRGAERLLYSSDGLIYITRDHYQNFIRME